MSSPPEDISPALVARLAKGEDQHKYDHGHALVLAGGVGRGGAGRLAARAALRVGAGLVTLGPPPAAIIENAAQLTSIMLRPIAGAADLDALLTDARYNALCLGPGLGTGQRTRALVASALATSRPTVLDADALTAFEEDPASLFAMLHPRTVMTPHMGEFARLFPQEGAELCRSPGLQAQRRILHRAAKRAHAVILLKGAVTRIADPTGHVEDHAATGRRAAPWLATAGSGDVLAGIITGLLARGFSTLEAAHLGTWLHVEVARRVGPGLIAEDLPDAMPGLFRALLG